MKESMTRTCITGTDYTQGEGATSVTSDVHGNIKISSENTWQPNTATQGGYVAKGEPNKVWSTDNTGAPAWREQESKYVHPDSGVKVGTYTKSDPAPNMMQ